MGKVTFSQKHSSIEAIQEYYVDSETSLNYYFTSSLDSGEVSVRFVGYTKSEVDNDLKSRKETLDRMCSFEVLAAIEARFRIDYLIRCQKKKKDAFSKELRSIHKTKANRASLDDDIISYMEKIFSRT